MKCWFAGCSSKQTKLGKEKNVQSAPSDAVSSVFKRKQVIYDRLLKRYLSSATSNAFWRPKVIHKVFLKKKEHGTHFHVV